MKMGDATTEESTTTHCSPLQSTVFRSPDSPELPVGVPPSCGLQKLNGGANPVAQITVQNDPR